MRVRHAGQGFLGLALQGRPGMLCCTLLPHQQVLPCAFWMPTDAHLADLPLCWRCREFEGRVAGLERKVYALTKERDALRCAGCMGTPVGAAGWARALWLE